MTPAAGKRRLPPNCDVHRRETFPWAVWADPYPHLNHPRQRPEPAT
jgi:hypothetical protein